MKRLVFLLPVMIAFASCNNKGTLKPTTPTDSATLVHTVKILTAPQSTKISLKDSTLTFAFTEDVSMLLTPTGYSESYAVHITQDFTHSALNQLNYTTINDGSSYYDYLDDNMNNLSGRTISDTTINNVAYKKLHLIRVINFVKTYANSQLAINAQTAIINTHTDLVTFSSYVFYDKTYPATVTTANINYSSN